MLISITRVLSSLTFGSPLRALLVLIPYSALFVIVSGVAIFSVPLEL